MPKVRVIAGGKTWSNWTKVSLSAAYTTPADGWSVEARAPKAADLSSLQVGAGVIVMADELIALQGSLDRRGVTLDSDGLVVQLSGRDLSSALVDCSPGRRTWSKVSLVAVAEKWLAELGLQQVSVQGQGEALVARNHKVQPGETYWAALVRICKRLRLLPWMSPAGVLHLGRPNYEGEVVGHLVEGRNIRACSFSQDITGRYSAITVHGAVRTSGSSLFAIEGGGSLSETSKDDVLQALGINRPRHMDAGGLSSRQEARDRGAWEVSKRAFDGTQLQITVQGWGPREGELWRPNTRVHVELPHLTLSGPQWVAGVELSMSSEQGARATLHLREPDLLLPEVA